jgi:phenylacetate-CoA ligase
MYGVRVAALTRRAGDFRSKVSLLHEEVSELLGGLTAEHSAHTQALEGSCMNSPASPRKSKQSERALQAARALYEAPATPPASRDEDILALFRSIVAEVPAYRKFLDQAGVDASAVTTLEHFRALPVTNKRNYHVAYPLPELCRFGRLHDCDMLAVSSGSTGEPTVWPRFISDEIGTVRRFEHVLVNAFGADKSRTLAVVCFALGSWVGGMYSVSACRQLAAKGYPITVVSPGNNFAEILRVLPKLAPHFEQVVLFGYPPFVKDLIERGTAAGYDWTSVPTKVVMAGEVFSESWRQLVVDRLGGAAPELTTASLYGTADAGVLANETKASITIRRVLATRPQLAEKLFGEPRLPTLCQYDPGHRFFEQIDGELIFSGDGGVPLLRYNILDRGGLIPHDEMVRFLTAHQLDDPTVKTYLNESTQPFVYVFGRNNFAVSYYGANVYPENIAVGVEQPEVERNLTGKFVVEVVETAEHDSVLQVTVELVGNQQANAELANSVQRCIGDHLARVNSEYANYVPKDRQVVSVVLLPLGEANYFPVGVKHRYTRHTSRNATAS